MKILSAAEIREWDQFTIRHEPVASVDLMERAATATVEWLLRQYPDSPSVGIYCGKGNNGGDGLAIARLLLEQQYKVSVHILEFGHKGTADFQLNLARLHRMPDADIHFIQSVENLHPVPEGQLIIDALFGSGLNRPLEGLTAELVNHINKANRTVISVDIPSGLFTDRSSKGVPAVEAAHTLSFQCYKPAFLFAENRAFLGNIHVLDIGLHPEYYRQLHTGLELTELATIQKIYRPRDRFAHKGEMGHAGLICGSHGKMGAAVLAAGACLRSGTGLLTVHAPSCGYDILQSRVPEAMLVCDPDQQQLTTVPSDITRFDALGIGPGIGTASTTKMMLHEILHQFRGPMVLDADALNIMAGQKDLLSLLVPGTILTPHPKEFARLFGESANDFEQALLALRKSRELGIVILLKGHHSLIATPDGRGFFNLTGNAGMATGGSGDVLTGIITGLLAQHYNAVEAAVLGAYLHGLAGDLAAMDHAEEALIAGDIIEFLGKAWLHLQALQD